MADAKISILICNFNYAHFIEEAISSAITQTEAPYEVLVYDDGSTDKSIEIIKRFPVRLFTGANQGVAHARNRLLEYATGSHVLFLDGDDWLEPNAIEAAKKEITTHPQTEATYCEFRFQREFDATCVPLIRRRTPSVLSSDTCYKVLHYTPCHTIVFPHSWAIPFDETLSTSEDQAFWGELLLRGAKFTHIPEVLSVYRLHGQSRSHDRRLESFHNQVQIHNNLIRNYPTASKHSSFMKHVRWRRYKYALELYRQGMKRHGTRILLSSMGVDADEIPMRLLALITGLVLPAAFQRYLSRTLEEINFS